jgi:ArsR family transcriptional regulator
MLSDKNRVLLISLLQDSKKTNNQLLKKFKISQPTLSHHLLKLKKSKIIKSKKKGREVFYSLNKKFACSGCGIFNNFKIEK